MQTDKKNNLWELVIFDLDGTALKSDKTVSQRFQNAVSGATDKGIEFAFASGRTLESIIEFIEKVPALPTDTYIIACNGALIWQRKSNKIIRFDLLEQSDISVINDFAARINHACYLIQDRTLYTPAGDAFTSDVRKYSTLQVKTSGIDWSSNELATPKMMFIAAYNEIDNIQSKIPPFLQERYHFVRSEPNYLEVMKKGVNKGSACQFLSDYLVIPASRIIAVGDEYNDVEMLKFAGLGVAMENARREVKELADWVTLSNDDDGAAFVIENWILNQR